MVACISAKEFAQTLEQLRLETPSLEAAVDLLRKNLPYLEGEDLRPFVPGLGLLASHIIELTSPEAKNLVHDLILLGLGKINVIPHSLWTTLHPNQEDCQADLTKLNEGSTFPKRGRNTPESALALARRIGSPLTHADFACTQLSREHLQALAEACPNLQYLRIHSLALKGDALKALEKLSQLTTLDISTCSELAPNSLRHLQHTPRLQVLKCRGCMQFEPNFLQELRHTPNLEELDISRCRPTCLEDVPWPVNLKKVTPLRFRKEFFD